MEKILGQLGSQLARSEREREFVFSARNFERARRLIHDLAGISMSELKQDLVYGRLVKRLRSKGLNSFDEYLDLVEHNRDREQEAFINALTTNLTSFFREPHHFPILIEHARARTAPGPYRVWCSACSTGEEAYSIAIALLEAFPGPRSFEVLASDIDTQVLQSARLGVYSEAKLRGLSAERLRRFFQPASEPGAMQVRPELASRIDFRRVNLLERDWRLGPAFDAVFCRNVMIYFDKSTQRKLVERFHPVLRADGLLICGHSESLQAHADLFRSLGRTSYAPVQPVR